MQLLLPAGVLLAEEVAEEELLAEEVAEEVLPAEVLLAGALLLADSRG